MDDINEATAVPPGNGDAWLVVVTLMCLFLATAYVVLWRERSHRDQGCGLTPSRLVPIPDPMFQR